MNNKGYTLIELLFAVASLLFLGGSLYLVYLVIRALQKYIGG